jgi:hypothetical protein
LTLGLSDLANASREQSQLRCLNRGLEEWSSKSSSLCSAANKINCSGKVNCNPDSAWRRVEDFPGSRRRSAGSKGNAVRKGNCAIELCITSVCPSRTTVSISCERGNFMRPIHEASASIRRPAASRVCAADAMIIARHFSAGFRRLIKVREPALAGDRKGDTQAAQRLD